MVGGSMGLVVTQLDAGILVDLATIVGLAVAGFACLVFVRARRRRMHRQDDAVFRRWVRKNYGTDS